MSATAFPQIPKVSDPIVLVHGLCGFNQLHALRRPAKNYFPGIREYLEAGGNRVYVAKVSPTGSIARRAADLKRFIQRQVTSGSVHVIGHSMGGLDARYMTTRLGMEDRVKSVTSVGTPHRGTAFADWGWSRISYFITPLLRLMGVPYDAFIDLRTDRCERFNEEVPDVPGVRYYSVAGVCEKPWLGLEWLLPARIVRKAEGDNDGIVSVISARWGEHTDIWKGDHLNLVNWPNRIAKKRGVWEDRAPDYGRIVRRLAAAGF